MILNDIHRRIQRAPLNPLDVSTVVSIYPIQLVESKPTLTPGIFIVPPGTYENPSVVHVTSSSWWRELDENQPLLEIPVSSVQIAESIVRDYCNGMYLCDMEGRMPGLFYIPGQFSLEQVKKDKKPLLDLARMKQAEFWRALVEEGDIMWNRTQGNPLAVSDLQRLAARESGQKNKPWMSNFVAPVALSNCPACGSLTNSLYPICQVCKVVIDKKKFEELGLKFAQ